MSQPVQPWGGPPGATPHADAVTASDEMVQLLTPDGRRVDHPSFGFGGDDAEISGLLRDMVLARRYDQEGTSLQRQGELGLWPPLLGQEAAQIGSGRAVRDADMVFPTYREHGVALLRDVPVGNMFALFRGTSMGDWDIEGTRFGQYQIIIGAQTLHATGYAMALQRDGMVANPEPERNAAVLVYHGDGASSQGDVNESYVFAASFQAPVVFFCMNNQWAISEPSTRQSRIPLYQRAWGYGFPGVRVDGNDVLAVKAVTDWAMERARQGQGPAFIEAFTYRMGAHTTSDDPSKYRLSEETESWRRKDPIERVKTYLLSAGAIDEAWLGDLDAEADAFGERVRAACKSLDSEPLAHRFDMLYREPTAESEDERDDHMSYLARFEPAGEGEAR